MMSSGFGSSTYQDEPSVGLSKWLENSGPADLPRPRPTQDMPRHPVSIGGLGVGLNLGLLTSLSDDKVCMSKTGANNCRAVSLSHQTEQFGTIIDNHNARSVGGLSNNYTTHMHYAPSLGKWQHICHGSYKKSPVGLVHRPSSVIPKSSPAIIATNLMTTVNNGELSNLDLKSESINFNQGLEQNYEPANLNSSRNSTTFLNSDAKQLNSGNKCFNLPIPTKAGGTNKSASLHGSQGIDMNRDNAENENSSSDGSDQSDVSNLSDSETNIVNETERPKLESPTLLSVALIANDTNKLESPSKMCISKQEQENIKLSKFYKLECNKCEVKQSFTSYTVLQDHCQDKHCGDGEIVCCGQAMWRRDQLLEHLYAHKCNFSCADCSQTFAGQTEWKRHLNQHLTAGCDTARDRLAYGCSHCGKTFSSKYGLANHVSLHLPEGQRPHKCRHCGKGFGAKHAMVKHERTHLPDAERLNYVCDVCGKRFGYASTLDGHQKHVHQNERPFECHVCAKTFPIKGALTYHLTTHQVQDRVQCAECGIWLKNDKILRIHRKSHRGEVFSCPHCEKVSSTRNNLRMHMKRHSTFRPHPCALCARAFKTARDLKTHMVQHTGQKPYSCPFCPKTFASPSNFYAHRKMKHKVGADTNVPPHSSSELTFSTDVPFT